MKSYARIIALIFAVLMLIPSLVACANTNEGETTTEPAQSQATPESTGPEKDPNYDDDGFWKDDLPTDLNFNEIVTVLYWDDVERPEFEITEEQADTDMVNEAIYRRNVTTEDRLGVTFEWIGTPGDSGDRAKFASFVQNAYSGGTYYDIIATYSRTAGMLLTEGLIQDLNAIEDSHLNTAQPWWPKTMLETCSIKDSLFFVSGDISTNVLHFMYAVYYNMDMLKNFQIEDPISLVDSNQWTIDKLIELSSDLYQDLDQDGAQSDNDQYGFCSTYFHLDAFYTGSDMMCIVPDADDVLAISPEFFGQKTTDLVDKLGGWFKEGDTYVNPHGGSRNYSVPFNEGNCAFRLDRVYVADNVYHNGALRNADFEYGILPVPLYDENQEDYITVVGNPFTLWCVMQNAKDPTMSSAVIECMASEGYRKTSPMIFENNMKYRYTPDNAGKGDGARMFDIVRQSIAFDLGRIFSDSLQFMSEMPSKTAASSKSWATEKAQYDRILKRAMVDLNKSLEAVLDN
ncbi:MAG: extracellular solute-binding protein [Clostridia bacterium]|nr:extracellular solute-binding protein [Clostridia bacterium]